MNARKKILSVAAAVFCFLLLSALIFALPFMSPHAKAKEAAGRETAVNAKDYALVLTEYPVPNSNEIVKVTDPNGKEVSLDAGKLLPLVTGKYTLQYQTYTNILHVLRDNPKGKFTYSGILQDVYPMGEHIVIPSAAIESEVGHYPNYSVTISCDGETLLQLHSSQLTEYGYLLDKNGEYEITYSSTDSTSLRCTVSDTIAFTVTGDAAISMKQLPERIYYGNSINIGAVYGVYQGETYPAEVEITAPSGESEIFKDILYLPTEAGTYTFTATATLEEKTIQKVQQVEVVLSANSLIADMYAIDKIEPNVAMPTYGTVKGKGLYIQGQNSQAYFYYSKIIDLRKMTKKDSIIEFLPYADSDSYNYNNIRVSLVDVHNESNQISLYWWYQKMFSNASYMSVYVNGKEYGGINNESYTSTYGQLRTFYGTVAFDCIFNAYNQNTKSSLFNLHYDYEENAVYSQVYGSLVKIIDLDDPLVVGYSNIWKGFETGEVYLKVEFTSSQPTVGMYIYNIAGEKFNYVIMDNASNDTCFTVKTPSENFPDGVVGYNYELADYVVNSRLNNVEVNVAVYREDERLYSNVKSFKPTKAGNYKVVYSAVDNYGVEIKKEFPFEVFAEPIAFTVDLPEDEQVNLFSWYTIPQFSVSGGVGESFAAAALYRDGEKMEAVGGSYFIDDSGEYEVRITLVDFVGYTETKTYSLNLDTDYISLVLERDIQAVRAGSTVTFPSFETYDYQLRKESAKTLEVITDGNTRTYTGDEAYLYNVPDSAKSIVLKYYAGKGTDREKSVIKNVSVLSKTYSTVSDYLLYDRSAISSQSLREGVVFTSFTDQAIKFPNPLPAEGFKIAFGINADRINLADITLRLTDAADSEIVVDFRFYDFGSDGSVKVEVNGDGRIFSANFGKNVYSNRCHDDAAIASVYKGRNYFSLEGIYDTALNKLTTLSQREIASVLKLRNGRLFAGFTSGLVFAELQMNGVTDSSELIISSVTNQLLSYTIEKSNYKDNDTAGPNFLFQSSMVDARKGIGDEFVVSAAQAYDFIQSVSQDVFVKITAPDGSVLRNGVLKENETITLKLYGVYYITYSAEDAVGNTSSQTFNVIVADTCAPEITVNGSIALTAKQGDTLKVPTATVTDDVSKNLTATVYIKAPDAGYGKVEQGDSIEFDLKGTYYLIYSVQDKDGNIQRIVYKITVN